MSPPTNSQQVQEPKEAHLSNNQVVSEQPAAKHSMDAERQVPAVEEAKVSMRGGGCIGDCWDAFVCFECCKGFCDCCC